MAPCSDHGILYVWALGGLCQVLPGTTTPLAPTLRQQRSESRVSILQVGFYRKGLPRGGSSSALPPTCTSTGSREAQQ